MGLSRGVAAVGLGNCSGIAWRKLKTGGQKRSEMKTEKGRAGNRIEGNRFGRDEAEGPI